jgi:hypothetical protein
MLVTNLGRGGIGHAPSQSLETKIYKVRKKKLKLKLKIKISLLAISNNTFWPLAPTHSIIWLCP